MIMASGEKTVGCTHRALCQLEDSLNALQFHKMLSDYIIAHCARRHRRRRRGRTLDVGCFIFLSLHVSTHNSRARILNSIVCSTTARTLLPVVFSFIAYLWLVSFLFYKHFSHTRLHRVLSSPMTYCTRLFGTD